MGTTSDKLNKILDTKVNIKQAIIDKGVDVADTTVFADYAEKIGEIQSGGGSVKLIDSTRLAYSKWNNLPAYNFSDITLWNYMFYNCSELTTIPSIDTSTTVSTYYMFYGCTNLISIPQLNLDNATDTISMFYNCINLTSASLLNTGKVTNATNLFYNCQNLKTIYELDATSIVTTTNMFRTCTSLSNFGGLKNIKVGYGLNYSNNLTVESLMNCINGLADLTESTTQTLNIGATNLGKLSDEQKAIATSKNWSLA